MEKGPFNINSNNGPSEPAAIKTNVSQYAELNEIEKKKIHKGNFAYILSQLITIVGFFSLESYIFTLNNNIPFQNNVSYPFTNWVTKRGKFSKNSLIGGTGLTSWHLLTNIIYQPWKYHGKNTHWMRVIYKITIILIAGLVVTLIYSFILYFWHSKFLIGEYAVYYKKKKKYHLK